MIDLLSGDKLTPRNFRESWFPVFLKMSAFSEKQRFSQIQSLRPFLAQSDQERQTTVGALYQVMSDIGCKFSVES